MLESSLPTRQPQTMSCLTSTQLDLQVPMLSQKLILTSYCSRHLEKQAESRELRPGAGAGTLTGEQDETPQPGLRDETPGKLFTHAVFKQKPGFDGPAVWPGHQCLQTLHPGDSPAGPRTTSLEGDGGRSKQGPRTVARSLKALPLLPS